MGFFAALGRLLGGGARRPVTEADRDRLLRAWDLYDEKTPETAFPDTGGPLEEPDEEFGVSTGPPPGAEATHAYDRQQWHKKLRTVLDRLPDSQDQWDDMMADVGALGLDQDWVRDAQREEFVMLVRRVVADRNVSPMEQRKLELARTLIGLSEDEAETIVRDVVAEAESFFGGEIEGAH
jgi:hypothetical protein